MRGGGAAAALLGLTLWAGLAADAPEPSPLAGHMRWEVHYLGVVVGHAELDVRPAEGGGELLVAAARSADWYRAVYSLDDQLRSERAPGGGARVYEARFREGGFHQDLRLELSEEAVRARRSQRFEDGWRSWSDDYPGVPADAEDPLSAFQRVREQALSPGVALRLPVFDGKALKSLAVRVLERAPCPEPLAERACLELELEEEGGGRGAVRLLLSDDAERLPARVSLRTAAFSVRAELTEWGPPLPAPSQ